MSSYHLIVGAGEAGVAGAFQLRRSGFAGRITLVHGEASLPYERPPLSKDVLCDGFAVPPLIAGQAEFDELGIELLRSTRALGIDAKACRLQVRLGDGREADLAYDRLLLATGAEARPLAGAHVLRTARDAIALRAALRSARRLAVVGGGVIGLEAAAAAHSLGIDVTVLEAADRILARCVPAAVATRIEGWHRMRHAVIRTGEAVREIETGAKTSTVHLSSGETVEADVVLAGIGSAPNLDLARAAGCAIDDGILVDRHGATSVEGIFAAGDAARLPLGANDRLVRLESWRHAREHGAAVGANMAGAQRDYEAVPWFWSDQYGHNLQVAGLIDPSDEVIEREGPAGASTFLYQREGYIVGAVTLDAPRDMRPAIKLIEAGYRGFAAALSDPATSLATLVRADAQSVAA